jgi:hypothetical protein
MEWRGFVVVSRGLYGIEDKQGEKEWSQRDQDRCWDKQLFGGRDLFALRPLSAAVDAAGYSLADGSGASSAPSKFSSFLLPHRCSACFTGYENLFPAPDPSVDCMVQFWLADMVTEDKSIKLKREWATTSRLVMVESVRRDC